MSLIGGLLGWTKLPQWALELVVLAALAAGLWYVHHRIYVEGVHAQQAADQRASALTLAAARARDAAILDAQLKAYHNLETRYVQKKASDLAIASAFARGVRRAYSHGRASALSEVTPSASRADAAPTGSAADAAVLRDVGNVLAACASDDARLTGLQAFVTEQEILFNPEKSYAPTQ